MKTWKTYVIIGLPSLFFLGWMIRTVVFPESEIRKMERVLKRAAAAIEAHKATTFAGFLTADFSADPHVDRESVVGQLKRFFLQVRDLGITIDAMRPEQGNVPKTATEARILVLVRVTGTIDGQKFQAFGSQGADALLVEMRKEQGSWLIARGKHLDVTDPVKVFQQIAK
jgi:hypothetical protein